MKTLTLLQVVFLVAICTGWVKNLIKFSDCDFEAPYKAEVIYGIGMIPIVGMVTGWVDVGK